MPKQNDKASKSRRGASTGRARKSAGAASSVLLDAPVKKPKPPTKKDSKGSGRVKRRVSTKGKDETFTAATADKHVLYQYAVQSPDEDVKFIRRVYKSIRKKKAKHLREDFCGTALLASRWILQGEDYTAEGFDIDPDPLGWGVEHNFSPLGDDAARCTLHLKDVREPSDETPDVRVAFNFSYCLFKERAVMVDYFKKAYEDLADDGLFMLDIHGGPEAMEEMEEEREVEEGFDYVWDQHRYWPATGDYRCFIHFEFEDGTRMERAFTYDWRLWGLPEIVDCLKDAGFDQVDSYWEGTDEDGESGDGHFRKKKKGENCQSWIAYIVCQK